jgi:hypothetical protein
MRGRLHACSEWPILTVTWFGRAADNLVSAGSLALTSFRFRPLGPCRVQWLTVEGRKVNTIGNTLGHRSQATGYSNSCSHAFQFVKRVLAVACSLSPILGAKNF